MLRRSFIQLCVGLFSEVCFKPRLKISAITDDTNILIGIKRIYKQNQFHGTDHELFKIVFQFKPRFEMMCTIHHRFLAVRDGVTIGYINTPELQSGDKIRINVAVFIADGTAYKANV